MGPLGRYKRFDYQEPPQADWAVPRQGYDCGKRDFLHISGPYLTQ